MTKWNRQSLLERFYELHKGLYSYGEFEYKNVNQRVVITCEKHGGFEQKVKKHLEGQGCKKCAATAAKSKWRHPTGYREPCGKQVQYQEYTVWRAMKQREKPEYWAKRPHYTGTTVSELFSSWDTYKEWYDAQFNSSFKDTDGKPFELDKDLLTNGKRCYSEDTCCFLPRLINVAIRNKSKDLGRLTQEYKDKISEEAYEALLKITINLK